MKITLNGTFFFVLRELVFEQITRLHDKYILL